MSNLESKREGECIARSSGQCLDLNDRLGFPSRLELGPCDRCLSRGGLWGSESSAIRENWARGMRLAVLQNPGQSQREVLVPLLIRSKPEEREKALNDEAWLDAIHKRNRWDSVKPSWERAASFGKAIVSRVMGGCAGPETRAERVKSCFGTQNGEPVQPACPSLRTSPTEPGQFFCGACGCGDTELARFSVKGVEQKNYDKLDYPALECPRQRPGFSNTPRQSPSSGAD